MSDSAVRRRPGLPPVAMVNQQALDDERIAQLQREVRANFGCHPRLFAASSPIPPSFSLCVVILFDRLIG